MFFAYNNGIAATASAATIVNGAAGMRLTRVTDLQIVNGGQTTATLAAALSEREAGLPEAFVQMKLSVLPPETSGKYIPLIARYANSQNRVSDADFFSNHEFHRRMEYVAQHLRAPAVGGAQYGTHWFYERARGQYANQQSGMTAAQRKQFGLQNPKRQLITKTDLAKYENAWRFFPHVVSQGAQKNFIAFSNHAAAEWDRNPDQFNEEYYRRVAVKAMLFRRTEELVSQQSWYDGGYRAQIVAYTLAKFSHLIMFESVGRLLDFKKVWNRQSVGPAIEKQLMVIAEQMFGVIVSPEGGFQNVTEWCKKEICWNRARDTKVLFVKELMQDLISAEEEQLAKKDAQVQQAIVSGIQVQTKVIELGSSYWKSLQQWGREKNLLSPDDDSILSVAAGMPRKIPTEKQCARLFQMKTRLEEEGYAQ
jgi:hypothetical protein